MKEVLLVVFRVPLGKMSETFSYPDLRSESVVLLQRSTVSTGHRNVAGLHTDQFPMALEVVVSRKNSGSDQFLLQRGNIVQKVLRPSSVSFLSCCLTGTPFIPDTQISDRKIGSFSE